MSRMGPKRLLYPPRSALLPVLLAVASLTCSGENVVLPKEGEPANLEVMNGNNQTGTVGSALAESLTVRITDPSDRPVVGARVQFALSTNAAGGSLSPDTALTDVNGEARSRWVLGTIAGSQAIQARVVGFTNVNGTLSATANADKAQAIVALRGDGQTGTAGAALAESLVVRVDDQFGNPVSGTIVSWTMSGGGALSAVSVPTGANGQSAVQRTLGPASGPQAAAASASGLTGSPIIFTHTASAGLPAALQIAQGDNNTAPAGFALAESLVVRLVDANGNGVAGRAVAWGVTAGGGSVSPTSSNTDANGLSATRWTLGATAGTNTAFASAAGFVANFSATGTSDVPTKISIFSGNNQTGAAGQPLANSPTVLVQDANNNPVANVAVTFLVTGGGGSIVPTTSVPTGLNGRAALTSWTLGPAVGPNTLQASASGPGGPLQGSPLTFTATAMAGSATQLTIETQPPATAASGAALSPAPVIQLRDASGNAVSQSGINVTVSLASGTGSLGGTLTRATNGSGQVTFSSLSINGLVGSYALAFNSSGLTGATSSSISLTAGSATRLVLTTQPPGGASSGVALSPQPIVQVMDAAGNPVSLAAVDVTAALTGGTGTLGGTFTVATNAGGTAAFTDLAITGPSGSYSLQFTSTNPVLTPVTSGNITIGAGAPTTISYNSGNNQSANAGEILPIDPSVLVTDAGGNPVSGVTVTFAVASGGGSVTGAIKVTSASGIATVGSWTLGCVAGSNTLTATSPGLAGSPLTFTATGNTGPASIIEISAGNNQTATVGTPVPVNPSVLVTDGCGNPVSGITTTFAVTAGGGSIIGGNQTTDGNGLATVGWILGSSAGTNTLTVTRSGLTGSPVTFTATGVTGSANNIAINGGNNQSHTIGTAVAVDPSVIVTDGSGNPVSGVSVTFAVASGGGSITGPSPLTNASGIATVGSWTLGLTAGTNTLTATSTGLNGSPVTFTATGTTGAPTSIAINGGNNQSATVGTTLPVNPSVIVRDIGGNPVPSVSVTFAVASGGGSITGGAATTDGAGVATVGSWTLGAVAGSNTLTATSAGLSGSPITFSATGTTGGATTIAINGGNNQSATVNQVLGIDPSVKVTDANGNGVQGVVVNFAVGANSGSITGANPITNVNGIATVGSWQVDTLAGVNTLTATAAGLTGSPVTFTATGTPGALNASQTIATVPNGSVGAATAILVQGRDRFGNNRTTGGGTVTVVVTGANSASPAVTDNGNGTYSASYTPANAGTDVVTIRVNSNLISGSPYSSLVSSAATTTAITGHTPEPSVVGQGITVDVTVSSAGGTPGGSVTVSDGTDNCVATLSGGSGSCLLTPSTSGTKTLTATYAGNASFGGSTSPGVAHQVDASGGVSPTLSTLSGSTSSITASSGSSTVTVTVTARDGFGNPISGATVVLGVTGTGNAINQPAATNGSGVATGTVSSTVAEGKTISATINGTPITQTQAVTVNPGAASAANSTANVPASGSPGNPTTITIQARDQFDNNLTVGGATVEVTVSGSNTAGPITATDNGDGTYTATYTPTVSGPDQVDITLNGTPISGSPYNTTVAIGGATQIQHFAGNGQSAPIGSVLSIDPTVEVTDAGGNPVSGVTVTFTVTGGGGSASAGSGVSGANGQVGVAWTLGSTSGANSLTASATGLSGSPVLFSATALPATPSVSIQSHTPDPSVVGELVAVGYSITSPVGTPTGNVTVSDGVDSCVASVAAGGCSLGLSIGGSRTLVASYEGDANYNPAASAGVGHTVTPALSTTTILAHTPDPSVVGQGITVDVTVTSLVGTPGGTVAVSDGTDGCVITLNAGAGSCVLIPTTAGSKTLTASYGGSASFASSSANAAHQVDPFGPVDPASSTATVPDGVAGSPTTITVQARDQFGNAVLIGGASVVADVTGANHISAVVTDNGDGTYTAVYTPANPGIDTVHIKLNNTAILGDPFKSIVS